LDRKHLMQLWEDEVRFFGGRSRQELMFFHCCPNSRANCWPSGGYRHG
jgi:hypothetical protein